MSEILPLEKLGVTPAVIEHLRDRFPLTDYTSVNSMEDLKRLQGRDEVIAYLETALIDADPTQLDLGFSQ